MSKHIRHWYTFTYMSRQCVVSDGAFLAHSNPQKTQRDTHIKLGSTYILMRLNVFLTFLCVIINLCKNGATRLHILHITCITWYNPCSLHVNVSPKLLLWGNGHFLFSFKTRHFVMSLWPVSNLWADTRTSRHNMPICVKGKPRWATMKLRTECS